MDGWNTVRYIPDQPERRWQSGGGREEILKEDDRVEAEKKRFKEEDYRVDGEEKIYKKRRWQSGGGREEILKKKITEWTQKRRYIKTEDERVKAEEKTDKKDDDR